MRNNDKCLHCVLMEALEGWFDRNGKREGGVVVIDIAEAISKLAECTVEITQMPDDRSQRRRAFRLAHDALDANLKSTQTGKLVPVDIPAEH